MNRHSFPSLPNLINVVTKCCYFGAEEESEGQQSLNATHVAWENDAMLPPRYAADGGRAGAFAPLYINGVER